MTAEENGCVKEPLCGTMAPVFLHVYDVTNCGSVKTSSAIVQLNKLFRDGIGLGGVFHSAVEVYNNEEWSFGYCESGSGVFNCPNKRNPMYTYRETILIGYTICSRSQVNRFVNELARSWQGSSYDLLSRNCNHFCDAFCTKLGVPKLPGWVNRFANAADAAEKRLRQAKTELASASKVAYRFLFGGASTSSVSPEPGVVERTDSPNLTGGSISWTSLLKDRVNLVSRNCVGLQDQTVIVTTQVDKVCQDKKDSSL